MISEAWIFTFLLIAVVGISRSDGLDWRLAERMIRHLIATCINIPSGMINWAAGTYP
jgi:hypothetical protein